MHLYLVRHGLCRHNLPDPSGVADDPMYDRLRRADGAVLIPQGIFQAELTGQRLKNVNFDAVYSSPATRAVMTAAGIVKFQKKRCEIRLWRDLLECGMADYAPPPIQLFCEIWNNMVPDNTPPRAEPEDEDDMWERAVRVRNTLCDRHGEDENVLVVSHGGFMHQYLLQAILEIPKELRKKYRLAAENAGITKLHLCSDGTITVSCLNETGHLGGAVSREPFDLK